MTRTSDATATARPSRPAPPTRPDAPPARRSPWPRRLALAAYSAIFLGFACAYAIVRPLWTDEIVTHHLARLPGLRAIHDALTHGPEASAPLHLLAAHACYRLAGPSPLAVRLPAILGMWAMSLALYRFVARRSGAGAAWVAALLPLSTLAFDYVAEGRSYGLLLGLSSGALVCWQGIDLAATARGRAAWRLGLWCCLAGAVFSHYFAVLCLVPLGLGELARTWRRRRADWGTWAAIVGGLAPLAVCLPFIRYASTFSHNFWARGATVLLAPSYYARLLTDQILPPLAATLVWLAVADGLLRRRAAPADRPGLDGPPPEEVVAAAGFASLPVVGLALAQLGTEHANFSARYALPTVIGLALLAAYVSSGMGRRVGPARVLALCLAAWLGYRMADAFRSLPQASRFRGDPAVLADAGDPAEPIAVQAMHTYYELAFSGPEALRSRLVFVVGLEDSNAEDITRLLAPLAATERPMRVEEYAPFVASRRRFLVFEENAGTLLDRLIADGATVELLRDGGQTLYRVTLPGAGLAASPDVPNRTDPT